jgi:hypothetical protein
MSGFLTEAAMTEAMVRLVQSLNEGAKPHEIKRVGAIADLVINALFDLRRIADALEKPRSYHIDSVLGDFPED